MSSKTKSYINSDYYSALADFGIDHFTAHNQATNEADLCDIQIAGVEKKASDIHGYGMFAQMPFAEGERIGPGRMENNRTLLGRFVNHSPFRNAVFVRDGLDIVLVAVAEIKTGDEITVDYRDSIKLRLENPAELDAMVAANSGIDTIRIARCAMGPMDSVIYDLLFNADHSNYLTLRERIQAFEFALEQMPQAEIPVEHEFIDGLYRRKIVFPKGTAATGAIHSRDHMDVMLTGEMVIATEEGFKHLVAPCCLTSRAGHKKAGFALRETTWVTYHPTSKTTPEEAEAEFIMKDFDEIEVRS